MKSEEEKQKENEEQRESQGEKKCLLWERKREPKVKYRGKTIMEVDNEVVLKTWIDQSYVI